MSVTAVDAAGLLIEEGMLGIEGGGENAPTAAPICGGELILGGGETPPKEGKEGKAGGAENCPGMTEPGAAAVEAPPNRPEAQDGGVLGTMASCS